MSRNTRPKRSWNIFKRLKRGSDISIAGTGPVLGASDSRTTPNSLARQCNALMQERDQLIAERNSLMQERDSLFADRQGLFEERDILMGERDALIDDMDNMIAERNTLLLTQNSLIGERNLLIGERDDLVKTRDQLQEAAHKTALGNATRQVTNDPTPGLLFNTLPKSASVFVLETLVKTLNKQPIQISPGYFPTDQVDFRKVHRLIAARGIAQAHVDASPFNQRYLTLIDKIILQFRDPRQATLSWTHHLERLQKEGQDTLLYAAAPPLPDNYFDLPFDERLDFQLMHYLPFTIEWMTDWVNYVDTANTPEKFLITTYEKFAQDPDGYFKSLLEFVGAENPEQIPLAKVVPTTEKNYRKGETDEWKSAFSEKQINFCSEHLPPALCDRFGWTA